MCLLGGVNLVSIIESHRLGWSVFFCRNTGKSFTVGLKGSEGTLNFNHIVKEESMAYSRMNGTQNVTSVLGGLVQNGTKFVSDTVAIAKVDKICGGGRSG